MVKEIIMEHLRLCTIGKLHHGFLLGWMVKKQIPATSIRFMVGSLSLKYAVPLSSEIDTLDVAMTDVCTAVRLAFQKLGQKVRRSSLCWLGMLMCLLLGDYIFIYVKKAATLRLASILCHLDIFIWQLFA
jgi:hypothetical protein